MSIYSWLFGVSYKGDVASVTFTCIVSLVCALLLINVNSSLWLPTCLVDTISKYCVSIRLSAFHFKNFGKRSYIPLEYAPLKRKVN